MSAAAKQVRPHVYADPDGAEYRCVEGVMQMREPDGDQPDGMEPAFSGNPLVSMLTEGWRSWIAEHYPDSVAAFDAAVADPMDVDEAEDDDCVVTQDRERAVPFKIDEY